MVHSSQRLHNFVCVNFNTVHLGEEIEGRYEADKAQARIDQKIKYCSSFKLFRLKTYQRYFVDLFSIDLFHSAVVDAVDGEVHEEDCQKVVGGSGGATVTRIQHSDVFFLQNYQKLGLRPQHSV